jgi:WD40 repeat protein
MHLLIPILFLSLCANNVSAGDQKQSKPSALSNFSLLKAFSLIPSSPSQAVSPKQDPTFFTLESAIRDVVWHPDGTHFATGTADRKIRVWHRSTKENVTTFKTTSPPESIVYSADGTMLAFTRNGFIELWNTQNQQGQAKPIGETRQNIAIFDPTSTKLIYTIPPQCESGQFVLKLRVQDIKTSQRILSKSLGILHNASLDNIIMHDMTWLDPTTLVVAENHYPKKFIRLYDIRTMQQTHSCNADTQPRRNQVACLNSDTKTLMYNNTKHLAIYDLRNDKVIRTISPKKNRALRAFNLSADKNVTVIENENFPLFGDMSIVLETVDSRTGKHIANIAERAWCHESYNPIFSSCGTAILAKTGKSEVHVWEQEQPGKAINDAKLHVK